MEDIQFGIIDDGDDDKERVKKVVDQLEEFLREIVEGEECDFVFFQELLRPMKDAWIHVSERFFELKDNVSQAQVSALQDHGLTSTELHYKLAVINHAAERFFYFLPQRVMPLVGIWLKRLLEAIDKFLSSLLDAVGGSGAIGEYKSFMEASINDGLWFEFA